MGRQTPSDPDFFSRAPVETPDPHPPIHPATDPPSHPNTLFLNIALKHLLLAGFNVSKAYETKTQQQGLYKGSIESL